MTLFAIATIISLIMTGNQVATGVINSSTNAKASTILKQLISKGQKAGVNLANVQETLSWLKSALVGSSDYGYTKKVLTELVNENSQLQQKLQEEINDTTVKHQNLVNKLSEQNMTQDIVSSIKASKAVNKAKEKAATAVTTGVESGSKTANIDPIPIIGQYQEGGK